MPTGQIIHGDNRYAYGLAKPDIRSAFLGEEEAPLETQECAMQQEHELILGIA